MSSKTSPEPSGGRAEPRFVGAAILTASRFLAVYWALQAFAFWPSMQLTWRAIIGVVSAGLFAIFLRVRAARVRADLIVLGRHSQSGRRPPFLGSVPARILSEARCDVLVVQPQDYPEV